ncbi:uncharacterized protein LOC132601771 [Lycium barbarum]|uniref:uncharacterized protein LOC132601771 n=1 Tax=Lycium barbarum TaxID=112863 RepID=UPI00293F37D3|nr:uncharacterized protein LOC132601771 [Lycium barbarum]
MTSNIAECINRHLVAARELPIFDFLEEVRKMFGRWNYNNRRNIAVSMYLVYFGCICQIQFVDVCHVEPSTKYMYTVHDGGRCFIAILKKKNLKADDYCLELFKSQTVVKTYDIPVDLLPDERECKIPTYISEDVVLPPRYKRPPGRPKKKRDKLLRELVIGKKRHDCSTCGQLGHNRRSCSFEPRKKCLFFIFLYSDLHLL